MTTRQRFEQRYPLPHGIVYSNLDNRYTTVIPALKDYCMRYNDRWWAWKNACNVVIQDYKGLVEAAKEALSVMEWDVGGRPLHRREHDAIIRLKKELENINAIC